MPNILFLSENTVFKEDLSNQIRYHIPDFEITEDASSADVIIIDEKMSLIKTVEKIQNTPVIFLSNNDVNDVKAQTVIQKPFLLSSFLDVVKASRNIFENSADGNIKFHNYILYPSRKEIYNRQDKTTTKLTEREVSVIKYLYKNEGKVVSKNDLMQEVWEYSADVATHTVETHIYRLRQKVENDNPQNQFIITSDGGYQLKI